MPRSGGSTTGAASNTQGQAKFKSSRVGSTEQEPGKGAGEPTAASPEHSIAPGRMITSQEATSPNRSGEAREEAGAHSYRFYDIADHGIDAETLGEIEVGLHDASVDEGEQVLQFMLEQKARLRELSMRMALKIADLVKISPNNWRNLAENTVMKRI